MAHRADEHHHVQPREAISALRVIDTTFAVGLKTPALDPELVSDHSFCKYSRC